ncbi:MAG: gliding motility-associated C-terminal domain-containing protein, partial [Bacteroidetes bacterium]
HLTGIDADNGCMDTDSLYVDWDSPPLDTVRWHLEAPPCDTPGWQATLVVDEVVGGTGPFVFSLDGGPAATTPLFPGLAPGTYALLVEDVNGCQYAANVAIPPPQDPGVAILGPHEMLLGDSVEIRVQTTFAPDQVAELIWQPPVDSACAAPCFSLWLSPNASLTLQVTAVDSNGCAATARHYLLVRKDGPAFAPTAFSPDGSGYNERFTLYAGPQVARIALFEIYDRWGTLLFRATDMLPNDPMQGWDGTFRGQPLPPGVYVWRAELVLRDGSRERLRGDVTLVR